jgi:bacillithiol system protein YtxJ
MKANQISDQAALAAAIEQPSFLLFKHSFRCGVSGAAEQQYDRFVDQNPGFLTGWIDVVEQKPLSNWVAELTGLRHQSPQAILFVDGKIAWSKTHHSITDDRLPAAVGSINST